MTYDVGGSVPDSQCNTPCLGDKTQMCGGPSLNHVMRVSCGGWGWSFVALVLGAGAAYVLGGAVYVHKVEGGELSRQALREGRLLPHRGFWRGAAGLVADGAAFARSGGTRRPAAAAGRGGLLDGQQREAGRSSSGGSSPARQEKKEKKEKKEEKKAKKSDRKDGKTHGKDKHGKDKHTKDKLGTKAGKEPSTSSSHRSASGGVLCGTFWCKPGRLECQAYAKRLCCRLNHLRIVLCCHLRIDHSGFTLRGFGDEKPTTIHRNALSDLDQSRPKALKIIMIPLLFN